MIVQNKNKDGKGNYYRNSYLNQDAEAVICVDGKNQVFKGNPKIVLRKGASKFGNQILFQFLINKKVEEYKANSKHDVLEFYFSEKDGMEFLKDTIKFFEGLK